MANYLKMSKRQQVIALLDLGWTYRRIETETGVRRETVSRYDRWRRANAAKVFPGSELPPRSAAAPYRSAIEEKLALGLSYQRIWQDLVEEYGYGGSYESVKRFARSLLGYARHVAPQSLPERQRAGRLRLRRPRCVRRRAPRRMWAVPRHRGGGIPERRVGR